MFSSYRAELMGVAIFGVLWGHIMNETWQPVLLSQLARLVHTAGFIFLSGFGLFYAYSKSSSLLSFYRRRITRLVIPFILLTYWFFMAALFTGVDSIPKFIANISAIAFWIYGEAHSWAMWYVSVTLLLSLMFPLFYSLIFRQRKRPVLYLILLIGIYLVFIGSIYHFFPTYWVNTEIGWTRVIIFLLGMYAGYLAQNNKELNLIQIIIYFLCCTLIAIVCKLWINDNLYAIMRTLIGMPIILILFTVISNHKLCKNFILIPLAFLGKHSYELYLLHVMFFYFMRDITHIRADFSMIIGITLALLLCYPTHVGIDKIIKTANNSTL